MFLDEDVESKSSHAIKAQDSTRLQKSAAKSVTTGDAKNVTARQNGTTNRASHNNDYNYKSDSTHSYRLLLVSSKIRNAIAFQSAILPGVTLIQYKYETSTLDSLLGKQVFFIIAIFTCLLFPLISKLIEF